MENKYSYAEQLDIFRNKLPEIVEERSKYLKNYLKDAQADGYVLGLSGGIDCAVVAMLCSHANIPVELISLPNRASMSPKVMKDCYEVSQKAGYTLTTLDITNICTDILNTANGFRDVDVSIGYASESYDIVKMNIPPRVRMVTLYAIAGAKNYLVAGTSNLSELVMGYFTKWGDGSADVEVLEGFTKSEVRELAKYLGVPKAIIEKKPSADLWSDQTDEDEMGMSYEELDTYIMTGKASDKVSDKINKAILKNKHKLETGFSLERYAYLEE